MRCELGPRRLDRRPEADDGDDPLALLALEIGLLALLLRAHTRVVLATDGGDDDAVTVAPVAAAAALSQLSAARAQTRPA